VVQHQPGIRHIEPSGRVDELHRPKHLDELAAKVAGPAVIRAELRLERYPLDRRRLAGGDPV
jgi:hypothetical protein